MTIPFLDFFRKKTARPVAAPAAPLPPLEKPSSERFSKTVMPNSTRQGSPQEPLRAAPGVVEVEPATPLPRQTISFNASTPIGRPDDLPPAVALALEPRVERAISLDLKEVLRQMPEGLVRSLEEADIIDRQVLLKASEIERGMAIGKPSVSVATIYEQVPEIFLREVGPTETMQVLLPFEKVLEQFSKMQVRSDQKKEQAVPQVETPFLKVTLEDDVRFGTTTTEQLRTDDLPPVRVELATAEALAAAEPEAIAREKTHTMSRPVQFPASTDSNNHGNGNGNGSRPAPTAGSPARIPFKLSPKGTDGPAPPRVPASGGPSVPTSSPARVPFKMSPSGDRPAAKEPWLTKESFANGESSAAVAVAAPVSATPNDGVLTIALALKPILQSLSPLQLIGDTGKVSDDTLINLPFSLLEPQLSSGRVVVSPGEFARNLPAEHRELFNADETLDSVVLPLPEILKKLPTASLRMRDDQVEQEKGANYMTPFSLKAEEDAERMKVTATPVPKPVVAQPDVATPISAAPVIAQPDVTPPPEPVKKAPAPVAQKPAAPLPETFVFELPTEEEPAPAAGPRSALQTALDTDDELDAKAVVAHVTKMAGVKACAIMFADGLSLAGSLPEEYEADGLCAMAPQLLQRIENHMVESKLGALRAMTLSCSKAAVTFFMHENLCLAALHTKEELASDVRERLARAVDELSRKYSHPV